MAPTPNSPDQPAPLRLSRLFKAPRALVFKAWSSAEHVRQWFCPSGYTVPEAVVEMHVGGRFDIRMRAPDATDHWTRGIFVEVAPLDRLVFDGRITDANGRFLFQAYTEVDFRDEAGGTRLDVVQTYTFADPAQAAPMVQGAPIGWRQTLDKLDAELLRMAQMVVHGTFHVERTYDAPVARVFQALSEKAAKAKWFCAPPDRWQVLEREMEFRVGGRERLKGRWADGTVTNFEATYHDIVPNERIIYSYEMYHGDQKLSVSLATMQLKAAGPNKTTLLVTEQGAYLDGNGDASRAEGTAWLLDALGASLKRDPVQSA